MRSTDEGRRRLGGEALRFLLAGGLNTAATLLLYWALLRFGYAFAYTVSFISGIALAYHLQGRFVFRARGSATKAAVFPLIYALQYVVGLGVLWIWKERLHLPEQFGVFASIAVTLPLTFLLSRTLFRRSPPSVDHP